MAESEEICAHLRPGTWPFQVCLVLDEQLGFTDAVVSCGECGRAYLLEMLDWRGNHRLMRLAVPGEDQAAGVIRDLERGSCDENRAQAELHHLRNLAPFARTLLLMDASGPAIEALVPLDDDVRLPGGSWRELPCDGSWVDYARSKTRMVNG